MSVISLGIDVAKETFEVALLRDDCYELGSFPNTPSGFSRLTKWLKKQRADGVRACLEATGAYGDVLAQYLHDAGHVVSVVNPARIKAYSRSQLKRNKNDREDSKLIAHFCATQNPPPWTPPLPEHKTLQSLTRHLHSLKEERVRVQNKLTSSTEHAAAVQRSLEALRQFLDQEIAALEQEITAHIKHHAHLLAQVLLLQSIPGIGFTTAAALLGEVPDLSRFHSADQLAAYAGLTPRHHQSGATVRGQPRLSKMGSRRLRSLFYMPAMSAIRFNPIIKALAERLRARGKHAMTILVAAMRKLMALAYGVLKHGKPFDPNYLHSEPVTT